MFIQYNIFIQKAIKLWNFHIFFQKRLKKHLKSINFVVFFTDILNKAICFYLDGILPIGAIKGEYVMSININSYSGISTRKGISGLMSGLDTDDIVKQLTYATRSKITKQLQDKQILEWKQSAYQNISKELTGFYNKYFQFSSGSNSIMNDKFFDTGSVTSSSSKVNVSGNSANIENVIIKDIQQLASKTGFTSSHKVSKHELSSGTIYDSWENNTIAGNSLSISYGGKSYNINVSKDFYLNSNASDSENIAKVVDELNKQINSNADLKGKLEFSVGTDGAMKLSEIGATKTGDLKVTGGSNALLTSLGFYKADAAATGSSEVTGAYKLKAKSLFETNRFAGYAIELNLGDKTNKVYLNLPGDFQFSAQALEKDASGNFTAGAKALQKQQLQDAYNKAISDNPTLKDKISVTIDDSLKMTITSLETDGKIKVTGGDKTFLAGLGLTVAPEGAVGTASVTGQIDVAKVMQAETKQLGEVLSGTSLTFNLNGITKTVTFKESEKTQFSTVAGLKDYLQKSLDTSYGQGSVTVNLTGGKLSFTTADPSHIISLQASSASGILGENGALHIVPGESNRAEYGKTLDQLKDNFALPLTADADGKYKIEVNGKAFEFTGDTMLGDVISKINRDTDVGVTISYSSITDQFTVMADETGANGKVDIKGVGSSNLASVLFGTQGNAADGYNVEQGKDLKVVMSLDGGKTFTTVNRSTNSFEMDGVTFDITGMEAGAVEENITFTSKTDVDGLVKKIKDFVEDYNKIIEMIQTKVTEKRYGVDYDSSEKYLPLTEEQKEKMSDKEIENWEKKAQLGLLANDRTLNSILSDMRRAMSDPVGESALHQIGITTADWKTGGLLMVDETKLRAALAEDPTKVSSLFTGENGIASRVDNVLKEAVIGNAQYEGKPQLSGQDSSSLSTRIKSINNNVSDLKVRLKTEETRWYNKFTALETAIARLNSQSQYFTNMSSQG